MIRGKTKPVQLPGLHASIHNRFDIEVIDAATGEIKQKAYAENVILNQLWTANFWTYAWFKYIHYGTGTSTPTATDTQLEHFYAAVEAGNLSWGYTADTVWAKKSIQLLETVAVGQTLAEIGVGRTNAAGTLCTRALLRDMNGNIITIAKTDRDILNIYATVYLHWEVSGYDNGYISVLPGYLAEQTSCVDIVSMALGLAKGAGFNCRFGGECCGYGTTSALTFSWNGTSRVLTGTAARLAAASANTNSFGGINTINGDLVFNVGGSWFSGSEIVGEPIGTGDGVTTDFSTKFGAVKQGAKIYLDGIEQTSGVSVDQNVPDYGMRFVRRTDGVRRALYTFGGTYYRDLTLIDGDTVILENPYYPATGVRSISVHGSTYSDTVRVYGSNDLQTWTQAQTANCGNETVEVRIPTAHSGYRYYALNGKGGTVYFSSFSVAGCSFVRNEDGDIHFTEAPAEGAIITADYTSQSIAKDSNHVFDFSFTITFGEQS